MESHKPTPSMLDRLIMYAVQIGEDINDFAETQDNFKGTFLQCAVYEGKVELVALLLNNCALVNQANQHGLTALHVAARCSSSEVVRMLLSGGANSSLVADTGNTALHEACCTGYKDVVTVLLDLNNPDYCNIPNKLGTTALHKAVSEGHCDIVELLIQRGADVNAVDHAGEYEDTALHKACTGNRIDIVRLLLKAGATTDIKNREGYTCAGIAVEQKSLDMVHLLNQHKVPLNDPELMQCAVINGDMHMIKFLEKCGNVLDDRLFSCTGLEHHKRLQVTLLQAAVAEGHVRVVTYLLQKGCDPTLLAGYIEFNCRLLPGAKNVPLLVIAAACADDKITKILIREGCSVNASSSEELTPLHVAAHFGQLKVATLLLSAGADRNAVDDWGDTPSDSAEDGSHHFCLPNESTKNAQNHRKIKALISRTE